MIPSTVARVPMQTADAVNERIRRQTEECVTRVAAEGRAAIQRRLEELDEEWDIERVLESNAATVSAIGAALALTTSRRFALVPLAVGAFLLQHAVQGWCPPLPMFRRLGFRTQREIDDERAALKALRGDFRKAESLDSENHAIDVLKMARG